MTTNFRADDETRMEAAIAELQALVLTRYPATTFTVGRGEDPESVEVVATVDVDDPDEVTDLVVERLVTFLVDGLPLHFVPIRTPERTAAVERADWLLGPLPSIVPLLPT